MNAFAFVALLGWIGLALPVFKRLSGRRATIVYLLGGWAILPTAAFPNHLIGIDFPPEVAGVALPAFSWLTKATAIGLGGGFGILLYGRAAWRRFHFKWHDTPMAAWCLWPLVPVLRNGLNLSVGVELVSYHVFAWGVPYLLGRLYITDGRSLRELALGLVVAGAVYMPLCWVEFYTGPIIYPLFYEYHPFQFDGHLRYIGYRPLVFMEHGNQLGMWMATASLAALWLWRAGEMPRLWRIPGWLVVLGLSGTTLMCQSVGSILLLVFGLMLLTVVTRSGGRRLMGLVFATLTLVIVVHGTNSISLDTLKATWLGEKTRGLLHSVDRASLAWRLRIDQHHLDSANQRPLVGWGRADWWQDNHPIRPWGMWLLIWGMYGLVGWTILGVMVLGPTYLILMQATRNQGARDPLWNVISLLAAVLFINMGDAFLNSTFIGVLVVISGALTNLVINRRLLPLRTMIRTELAKHFGHQA